MALFMYECDNQRQMENVEQRTSSWEDNLNVGPINCVWRGMGVCSTWRKHRNYAPAVWYIWSLERLISHMDGEHESDLNRPKGKKNKTKHQSLSWPFSKVISDGCFVEALALVEELCNVIAGILQQVILNKELDPLRQT